MLNISQSWNQRLEVNCGPRSEVIVSGTPKREIQVKVKAFVHAAADVSERGMASIHLDVRSVMVKIQVKLLLYCNGPTKSTCRWEKRRCGMGRGTRRVWRWILPCWQARHPRAQAVTSLERPRHTNLDEIIRWDASLPGWAALWKCFFWIWGEQLGENCLWKHLQPGVERLSGGKPI